MPLVPTPKRCDPSVKKAIQILTQKIGLKSNPIFNGLTLTGLTQGEVLFAGVGGLVSSDVGFVYDSSNGFLGLGRTPTERFHAARGGNNCNFTIETYWAQVGSASAFMLRNSYNDTIGTKTTTPDNTVLGQFNFQGVDSGGNFDYGAYIIAKQDGAAGVRVPTNLIFNTYSSTGINDNQLVLWNDGSISTTGKVTAGSFSSPLDVTNTRQYGFEIHYSGNDYDVTGIRSRARLKTTDTTAIAQGALLQAANEDGINAGVLNGALIEAIGKSDGNAATIAVMRGALVNTEWGDYDTVTNLKTLHVRTHSRNAAGAGSFGTGYGIYIENEAVGGNGQAYGAGIYFKGTNLSAGNKAFTYGIDFSGGTYGTADIKLSDGSVINDSNGNWSICGIPAEKLTIYQTADGSGIRLYGFDDQSAKYASLNISAFGTPTFFSTGGFTIRATTNMRFLSGAIYNLFYDCGGQFIFRDVNAGNAIRVSIDSANSATEWMGSTPYHTLINDTHSDDNESRKSRFNFLGEQSGGEQTTLARIEVGHDGTGADEKAYLDIFVNTGSDGDSPTKALRIDSSLLATFAGTLKSDGGRVINRTSVTSSPHTVLAAAYHHSITTASVAITLNLPAIIDGTIYHFKDQDENSSGNNITLSPNGADTIENAASLTIVNNGASVTLVGNSTTNNWEIQ